MDMAISIEDNFLADIAEHPDDDTPRLILADWLEEREGAGDAARAAFIRIQCEIASLPEESERLPALRAQERELFQLHGPSWTRELGRFFHGVIDPVSDPTGRLRSSTILFHRGFGEAARCRAARFGMLRHNTRRRIIRYLEIYRTVGSNVIPLLRRGDLDHLEHLSLRHVPTNFISILRTDRLKRLRELLIAGNINNHDLTWLANCAPEQLPILEHLTLDSTMLSLDQVSRAFQGTYLRTRLQSLMVNGREVQLDYTPAQQNLETSPAQPAPKKGKLRRAWDAIVRWFG